MGRTSAWALAGLFAILVPALAVADSKDDPDLEDVIIEGAPTHVLYPRSDDIDAFHDDEQNRDLDLDGIPNVIDQCPESKGVLDYNGCPALLDPDWDGDGWNTERCPDHPEDLDGFEDDDGCPEPDNDWDGLADRYDACRDLAEDIDGFYDSDGCPDIDNDGDRIPDERDACRDHAEDFDGFQDEDGCPDLDNDGEGIPDTADACPNRAETINGFRDDDGCPDRMPAVTLAGDRVELTENLVFVANTNYLDEGSSLVLDEIARLLHKHGELRRIQIEGYTDSQGSSRANKKLSLRRAQAVREALIRRGIESKRLTAVGFGERWPAMTNATRSGRAANRRVELRVLETSPVSASR